MDVTLGGSVVVGGASGLGRAVAERLVQAGSAVTVIDRATSEASGTGGMHGDIQCVHADVTSGDQLEAAFRSAERLAPTRVLVHTAGIGGPLRILDREGSPADLDAFKRVVEVNLVGTFNAVRLGAAAIARTPIVGDERGVIILTSSIAAFEGRVGQVHYAAAKAGVAGMTISAARDLASRKIRVVSIAPGTFDTPMLATLPQTTRDTLAHETPHPSRLGSPSEFAALVAHIVENPMINGEVIRLDGALRMSR